MVHYDMLVIGTGPAGQKAAIQAAILKLCFWGLAIIAVPVSLSIIVSMSNWLGTSGQASALSLHKYSSLVFFLVAVVMAHFVLTDLQQKTPSNSSSQKQTVVNASAKN